MAILGPKRWVNPFEKMSIFGHFKNLVFIAQKGVFLFQNMLKDIFLAYITFKKKLKNGHFWTKNMGYPLGKNVNLSSFSSSSFYGLERRYFVLEYHKRHFPGLYWLKKKLRKMVFFGAKRWVNPFGKMSIFGLFEHLFFIAQKGVFSFQNLLKDIFLSYIT